MNPITLRNLPPALAQYVRRVARERRLSLNRTVIALLEEASGLVGKKPKRVYHDLDHLMGTWSKEESDAFLRDLQEQRRIDPELWS